MLVSDLIRHYDYGYWANKRLLSAVSELTPKQVTQSVAGSHGSVRNTLVHVLSAHWGWLDRCGGHARGERLKPEAYPTVDALTQEWDRVESYVRELLSGLADEDLAREVECAFGDGPTSAATVGELMQHAALHAVHHHKQVALLLRALGHVPGDFDLLFFVTGPRGVPT